MCRFALYLGPEIPVSSLITEPDHSIIHQSFHSREREEPLNGDGFGLAWYDTNRPERPALFKDVSPAWNNFNLRQLAPVTRSACILAHVRAATEGFSVSQWNCHPFASGCHAFAHNGTVEEFRKIKRKLLAGLSEESFHEILGSTDSEHVFALFKDALKRREALEETPLQGLAEALRSAIEGLEELRREAGLQGECSLNLAVTDGTRAAVSRYVSRKDAQPNSLYVHTGRRYLCQDGVCVMTESGKEKGAVVVSSEPLSQRCQWTKVPANHLAVVDEERHVEFVAI